MIKQVLISQGPLAKILDLAEDAIISIDEDQKIILYNRGAEKIFGYTAEQVQDQELDILLPGRFWKIHRRHVQDFGESSVSSRQMGERREIFGKRKDGSEFPAEASISKAEVDGKRYFTVILRDITDRKITQEVLLASLREKEVLLKEIHHRVKNNLQVVTSLLGLQSRGIADESVKKMFQESQNRIHAMSLLHETLYQSDNLSAIDCKEYAGQLAAHLFRSYGVSTSRVRLNLVVEHTRLSLDVAVPCGLILNELVSNALKYAFPDGREGEIRIEMVRGGDRQTILVVSDNGVGLPAGVSLWSTSATLGLRLVRILGDQLGAEIEVGAEGGTEVRLTFPVHSGNGSGAK